MPSYKPVAAALRVLDVLAAVNRLKDRATIAELHRRTSIDKATIVRMLETLAHAGYLARAPEDPVYRVTGKTLSLSTAYDRHTAFGTIIAPLMVGFRQRIGWPSDIALFDTDAMLVVRSSREGEAFSFNRAAGFRAPMLATSLGLAYLAFCPEAERAAILARIAGDGSQWSRLALDPKRLQTRLATIRRQGFATMDAAYSRVEYEGRVGSIGVAIRSDTRLFATINVIYLTAALTPAAARATLLDPLRDVAARMAEALERFSLPQQG